jgi:hypothetical protein
LARHAQRVLKKRISIHRPYGQSTVLLALEIAAPPGTPLNVD